MPEHRTGTREEWQAARDELAQLEAEQARRNEEIHRKRLELPWVAVDKDYQFDTRDGKKSLADLFEAARSFSLTTSCSAPRTRAARARGARA
jgi:predicted dithiol-disulfide oxidoreductase (DUF899 family)